MEIMPLSLAQIYDVCLATDPDGKCCRYLSQEGDSSNYHCLKKTNFKSEIDQEIKENISKKLNIPKGDNCEGYPVFSRLVVGYDMKKH